MINPIRAIVLPSMVALALGGCAHQEPPANSPGGPGDMPMPPSMGDGGDAAAVSLLPENAGATSAQGTTTTDPTTVTASNGPGADVRETVNDVPSSPVTDLSDAQILEVTRVANRGEIEQAKLAESKSRNPQVKKLAAMMIEDHTEANRKGAVLAKNVGLTPSASATSASLEEDASNATSALKGESGSDFDKRYADIQIREHQAVLDAIGQKLVPNAKNADLKAYLFEVQARVALHLQEAQTLRNELDVKPRAATGAGGM